MDLCPFETIDVLTETVPDFPIPQLPSIVERAAKLLSNRTHEEINNGSKILAWLIDSYFETIEMKEVPRLFDLFGKQLYDGTLPFSEDSLSPDEFAKECENYTLNYIRPANTTEFVALQNCIKLYKLDHPDFPNASEYEYFAILSLWLAADSIDWNTFRSGETKFLPNNIPAHFQSKLDEAKNGKFKNMCFASIVALEAMNSICYAEHLASVDTKVSASLKKKESLAAHKRLIKRHAINHENEKLAVELFFAKKWKSPRQAAIKIYPMILENGLKMNHQFSEDQIFDTVYRWILKAQKKSTIKV
jgi:hypothetical protein